VKKLSIVTLTVTVLGEERLAMGNGTGEKKKRKGRMSNRNEKEGDRNIVAKQGERVARRGTPKDGNP